MTNRERGIVNGAISGVLASTAFAIGSHAFTAEMELLRKANDRADAVLTPVEIPQVVESAAPVAPAVEPPPEPEAPYVPPARGTAADLAERQDAFREWRAEMVRMGVPDAEIEWLAAQAWTESRWRRHAVSPVGARGVAQFLPATWAEEAAQTDPSCEGVDPTDPTCAARAQRGYMGDMNNWLPRDGRTRENALYAYNTGIGRVRKAVAACRAQSGCDPRSDRHMERRVSQEPRNYRKRIFSVRGNISREGYGATFGFSWN